MPAIPHDVVVVGARVAGTSTALLLSRLGYRVLIVDRAGPPRDTLSTHALLRAGVIQLDRWGVLDRIVARGTPAIRQVTLGFGESRIPITLTEDFGVDALYAPRRTVLDAELLAAACAAGAEFRTGLRVEDVTRDADGRVSGVVATGGGNTERIPARFVVGADGLRSRVAAAVEAQTYESHPATNAVVYAYYADLPTTGYEWQFTPGTSAGFMPTNDGLVNVWAGRRTGERVEPHRAFLEWMEAAAPDLAARVARATRVGRYYTTPGIPGFMRTPYGAGWALVGDAGSTKDPSSAHGITDALRDAELLARAVAAALADPAAEAEHLARYHRIRDQYALPIYREAKNLAAYTWDEGEASQRLRTLGKVGDAESEMLRTLPDWPVRTSARAA